MSSIGSGLGSSNGFLFPVKAAGGQDTTAAQAKKALAQGIQDGGPVTDYKPTSDRSGAAGESDYWSALGYDA